MRVITALKNKYFSLKKRITSLKLGVLLTQSRLRLA